MLPQQQGARPPAGLGTTTFSPNNPYVSPGYSPTKGPSTGGPRQRMTIQPFTPARRPLGFASPYDMIGPSSQGEALGSQVQGGTTYYPTSPSHFNQGRKKEKTVIEPDSKGVETNPALWTGLDISGMGVCVLSPTLWEYTHLTQLLLNDNKIASLPAGISKLKCLVKLDLSDNRLQNLPEEIGEMNQLKELILSNNALSVLPYSMGKLIELVRLDLLGNPLQPPFSIELEKGVNMLLTFMLDSMPVPPPPPERPYLLMAGDNEQGEQFSVLCYNILSDPYATRQMFGYCPTWALDWDNRKEVIKKEIIDIGADIVCLQEVETSHYHRFFLPELRAVGYEGVFYPKTRSRTMNEEDRKRVDGCAVLFRTSKFTLLEQHLIDFRALAMSCTDTSDDMINRVMPKDNIAVACVLELRHSHTPILVANAHLHWNPVYKDVKLIQAAMLMNELGKVMANIRRYRPGCVLPTVLCGDFNSLPDSGVFELLQQGHVSPDHPDLENTNYGSFVQNRLRHNFNLQRCYNGEMPYTNYTYEFKGIIDYIWFSADNLNLSAVLGPVPESYMEQFLGCPTAHHPSDHFPLVCELKVRA